MASIYLRHATYGEMVASSEAEAVESRKYGWVDFDPTPTPEAATPSFLGGGESDIPASFPGREALIAGGVTTWVALVGKPYAELITIQGITSPVALEILKALD
jgi:hypothetical protein